MKVEVAVPVPHSPHGVCGRKATLNLNERTSWVGECAGVQRVGGGGRWGAEDAATRHPFKCPRVVM